MDELFTDSIRSGRVRAWKAMMEDEEARHRDAASAADGVPAP
jgi:hypothetical protein